MEMRLLTLAAIGLCLAGLPVLAQPKSAGTPDPKLIEDLVVANRVLADLGVLDGFGHVSVRHDKDANRYLMSRSMAPALVKADDVLAGFLATKHLIKLGHKRIGHLYGPGTSNANDRLKGYRSALEQYGLSYDERLVRTASYPYESSSYEVMRIWLNEAKRPTALFAFNDPSGIGATRAVEDAGLRVPVDVAIVGCGNIHYGELLKVPLTTVSWSAREMGQVAAKRLIEMIEGSCSVANRFEEIVLRPEMVVRSSCGAAKKVLVASERG